MNKIKIFISYAHEDDTLARRIKHCLENCLGLDVFLSSTRIRVSQDWFKKIWNSLNSCDIFMPLISENFLKSYFANQELGFCVAQNKHISPISLDGTKSKGLIYTTQAFDLTELDENSFIDVKQIGLITELMYVILYDKKFVELRPALIDNFVKTLKVSPHYKITSIFYNLIKEFYEKLQFSPTQLRLIKESLENNPEIYGAGYIFPNFKEFLQSHYNITIDR